MNRVTDRIRTAFVFWVNKPETVSSILDFMSVAWAVLGYFVLGLRDGKVISLSNTSDAATIVVFSTFCFFMAICIASLQLLQKYYAWSLTKAVRKANTSNLIQATETAKELGIVTDPSHQLVYLPGNPTLAFLLVSETTLGMLIGSCAKKAGIVPGSWNEDALVWDIRKIYRDDERTELAVVGISRRHPEYRESMFRALRNCKGSPYNWERLDNPMTS